MNNRIQNRSLGWVPDDFSLKGTDGEVYILQNILGNNGLVVMFICNHCPYVKAITKQLVEDVKTLKENDISSIAIMSNDFETYPDDNYENMQKFSERNIPLTPFIDNIFLISSLLESFLFLTSREPIFETFFSGKNFKEFGFGVI